MKPIDKNRICSELEINPDEVYNIYRYGSLVYGTDTTHSDEDFIIVRKQYEFKIDSVRNDSDAINATMYSLPGFKDRLYYQEIHALECLWLPDNMKIERFPMVKSYQVKKTELRKSISAKASNSWVGAKKKFEVHGDIYRGQKSVFHSLRIFNFGIQTAKYGKIVDYQKGMKELLKDIKQYDEWDDIKKNYQLVFNSLHSEFKKLTS